MIAMAAGPTAWAEAWPKLPALTCIQLVYVAADGKPAKDRGLSKRTYAGTHDAVVILGCPLLERNAATATVAEGLGRRPGPGRKGKGHDHRHPRHQRDAYRRRAGPIPGHEPLRGGDIRRPGRGQTRQSASWPQGGGHPQKAHRRPRRHRSGLPRFSPLQGPGRGRGTQPIPRKSGDVAGRGGGKRE